MLNTAAIVVNTNWPKEATQMSNIGYICWMSVIQETSGDKRDNFVDLMLT